MPKYVALLRGISPTDPRMHNEHLRRVFVGLGLTNVKTVISSGNVVFESPRTNTAALEAEIEKAIAGNLGFTSSTIVRSLKQIQQLVAKTPFKNLQHGAKTYLTVTFLKHHLPADFKGTSSGGAHFVGVFDSTVCYVVDTTATKTPNLMLELEKQLGKQITTRTYKTVERILKVLRA